MRSVLDHLFDGRSMTAEKAKALSDDTLYVALDGYWREIPIRNPFTDPEYPEIIRVYNVLCAEAYRREQKDSRKEE